MYFTDVSRTGVIVDSRTIRPAEFQFVSLSHRSAAVTMPEAATGRGRPPDELSMSKGGFGRDFGDDRHRRPNLGFRELNSEWDLGEDYRL
jgi:hypothetical protein